MLKVFPLMKARRQGVVINIAPRPRPSDYIGAPAYAVSKCVVIRAVRCLQLGLDVEGLGDNV